MSDTKNILEDRKIQSKIHNIRGLQVMLDRDLAELYGVKSIRLREQVRRNIDRFPEDFMFILTEEEVTIMVTQNAIPSKKQLGGYLPYVFTEQKQLITDTKFDKIFKAIEANDFSPKQGIFFEGQVYDAYAFISDLIKSALSSIVLIDNYIDETVLTLLSKRKKNCTATLYTKNISKGLQLDLEKYNAQYPIIKIIKFKNAHDRFLIIDGKEIYRIGASIKDLGKKWFAFSKFEKEALDVLTKLQDSLWIN